MIRHALDVSGHEQTVRRNGIEPYFADIARGAVSLYEAFIELKKPENGTGLPSALSDCFRGYEHKPSPQHGSIQPECAGE